jgi:hypothetical protein
MFSQQYLLQQFIPPVLISYIYIICVYCNFHAQVKVNELTHLSVIGMEYIGHPDMGLLFCAVRLVLLLCVLILYNN